MKGRAALALGVGVLLLAGCRPVTTAPAPTPAPTVTQTVTVTPPPPERTADTPVDALAAWSICKGLIIHLSAGGFPLPAMNEYGPDFVREDAGVFTVQLTGSFGDRGDGIGYCVIGGTLGVPDIVDWQMAY